MSKRRLDILTTGGTIASKARGVCCQGEELIADLENIFPDVEIGIKDICRVGSVRITQLTFYGKFELLSKSLFIWGMGL